MISLQLLESNIELFKTNNKFCAEWLRFYLAEFTGKTYVFTIFNKAGTPLGRIKWMPVWRRYCLFPNDKCCFDYNCLKEINIFIDVLMRLRDADKTS